MQGKSDHPNQKVTGTMGVRLFVNPLSRQYATVTGDQQFSSGRSCQIRSDQTRPEDPKVQKFLYPREPNLSMSSDYSFYHLAGQSKGNGRRKVSAIPKSIALKTGTLGVD